MQRVIRQVCPLGALNDYLVVFASTTDVDRVDLLVREPVMWRLPLDTDGSER